jgi:putative DNA primase/helicase
MGNGKGVLGEETSLDRSWAVEPWETDVDVGELLDELAETFKRHVVLARHGAEAMALWTLHAWAHEAATISPLLVFSSPEKRCGKTTALLLLSYTVPRPLPTANVTAAALFRVVEKWQPTLLIDEADTFLLENNELRGIINSGHVRAMAQTIRCVGDDYDLRTFRTWSPKVLALIGRPHDTLSDRSIMIPMRRRLASETVAKLRADDHATFGDLRRRAARWSADAVAALQKISVELPPGLGDRASDNWRPLVKIADLAGGSWPRRAWDAAEGLSRDGVSDTESIRTLLLGDLADALERSGGRMTSSSLVRQLASMEERPWPEWSRGQPITPRQVARLLRPLGIVPRSIRLEDGSTPKGYVGDDQVLVDALSRYLPSRSATAPQRASDATESHFSIRHTEDAVADPE